MKFLLKRKSLIFLIMTIFLVSGFVINGQKVSAEEPLTVKATHATGLITYTFNKPVKLITNEGVAVSDTELTSKFTISKINGLDYTTATKVDNVTITEAKISGNTLNIAYTGSLDKQISTNYIIEARGYKIADLDGNTLSLIGSPIFMVAGGVEADFAGTKLLFDKAVKITMAGEANKRVGYTIDQNFKEIAATCGADSQIWADTNLNSEGDCKINSGADLIIWTKHFTTFVSYNQTVNPVSGSNDINVEDYTSYCYKVVYSDWGNCINGNKYRNIINQTPGRCFLTASQQMATISSCELAPSTQQVLGVKKYADGTLLRAKGETKIYVIKNGKKTHIKSLTELKKYKSKILNVEPSVLNNY